MNEIMNWASSHLLLMFAIGIIICNFFWLVKCKKLLGINAVQAAIIAVLHDIIGYGAMKVLAIIEVGGNMEKAANMRLFGAVFALPLLYFGVSKAIKKKFALVMDAASICLVIGLIFGRLNCLTEGCCFGMLLPGSSALRWPIREMEIIYYLAFVIIYCGKILKGKTNGEVYPMYMITYGALRFILELFRVEYSGVGALHWGSVWAIISVLMGLSIYYSEKEKQKRKEMKR